MSQSMRPGEVGMGMKLANMEHKAMQVRMGKMSSCCCFKACPKWQRMRRLGTRTPWG